MTTLNNITIALALTLVTGLPPAYSADYEQKDDVIRIADGAITGAAWTLRSVNRVQTIVHTTDLDPGSVVTAWWRVYNRPRRCTMPNACSVSDLQNPDVDGSQLHAAAHVVSDANGAATIVASLYRTAKYAQGGVRFADSLAEPFQSGRGLRRPRDADIELVLVSHGRQADPDIDGEQAAAEQLLTPGGTKLDCADPSAPAAQRQFRCGVLQIVNIPPPRR